MQGSDFSKARVKDKVWSFRWGYGEIEDIISDDERPLIVKFPYKEFSLFYCIDGRYNKDEILPELYHDEIKFEIPPPPKRMVKKKIDKWHLVDRNGDIHNRSFETKEAAMKYKLIQGFGAFIYPVRLQFEIEVPEQ